MKSDVSRSRIAGVNGDRSEGVRATVVQPDDHGPRTVRPEPRPEADGFQRAAEHVPTATVIEISVRVDRGPTSADARIDVKHAPEDARHRDHRMVPAGPDRVGA